jgi:hypothetical protein
MCVMSDCRFFLELAMERYFVRVCEGRWAEVKVAVWRRARENSPGCLGSLELATIFDEKDEMPGWEWERWEQGKLVQATSGSSEFLDVMGFDLPIS